MSKRIFAGAALLVCAAAITVCGAQAPPVTGVCVANCGGGGGNTNTTTHAEARAYSSYVKAYNQALKQYQQAIRLGATAQGLSLCQSAQSSIDEALQYAPGDGDALNLRRGIMGCIDACNGVFAVRNGEYDRGIAFYRQAESDDPADRNLWEQGIAWAESARKQAIANVHPNVNVQPTPNADANAAAARAREKKAQILALWERGSQLRKSGDYKAEEAVWRQVIALDPTIPEAYSNLGTALKGQGRLTDALEAYQKATQLNPKDDDSQYELGSLLVFNHRYAEAETALRQALQLNPKNASAEAELGNALRGLGRPVEAEAAYQTATQMNPKDYYPQYELGLMLERQKRYAEAEAAYRKSIAANPNNPDPLSSLGDLLRQQGRYAEAEPLYRQAMNTDSGRFYARGRLADTLVLQKRYAEAEDLYRKALETTPIGDLNRQNLQHALESVIDLETKARQQKPASQPATPLITAGENLRDAPNSGGSGTGDTANSSPSQKALDEASSSLGATGQGLQSTTPEGKTTGRREDAVAGGSKIFDTTGPKIEAPPVDLRRVGKAPAVAKLLSHIPKNTVTTNDKEINASITWYSELESNKAEKQQQIADIQKQIDSKQGDPAALEIRKNQFKTDIQNLRQDQQIAEDAIKKRLVKLDMPWIENPASPESGKKLNTETKPDTATQEKQP
jgi:tetratricopeptide (TPR) repeat protein